jgi:hypothetical protein
MINIEESVRDRTCCECEETIPAGEFHLVMWGWFDDTSNWKHFAHVRCVRQICTEAHIKNND